MLCLWVTLLMLLATLLTMPKENSNSPLLMVMVVVLLPSCPARLVSYQYLLKYFLLLLNLESLYLLSRTQVFLVSVVTLQVSWHLQLPFSSKNCLLEQLSEPVVARMYLPYVSWS